MSSGKTITYIERLAYDRWVLNGQLGYRVYIGYTKNEAKQLYQAEWEERELMYGCRRNEAGKRYYYTIQDR